MPRPSYLFHGCTIKNKGYHQPDHCVWWEATDKDGSVVAHGKTLRECEFIILEHDILEAERKRREKLIEALVWIRDRLVAGVHDGSMDCYQAIEIAESALSEANQPQTERNRL